MTSSQHALDDTVVRKPMNVDEILSQLQRNEGHFAKGAVLEAVAHRDEVIPALLNVLGDVADNPEPYASDPKSMIVSYAVYLLAQRCFSPGCHCQLAAQNPKLAETTRVRVAAGRSIRNAADVSTVPKSN
jgi:hypothetical protein